MILFKRCRLKVHGWMQRQNVILFKYWSLKVSGQVQRKGFWCKATHPSASKNVKKYLEKFWCMVTVNSPSRPIWDPFSAHGDRGYVTILAPALRPPPLSFLVKSHLVKSRAFKEMCCKSKILACFFLITLSSLAKSTLALINLYLNKVFGFSFNKLLVRNDLKW